MNNNPVRYNDPTGHSTECGFGEDCVGDTNPSDTTQISGSAELDEPTGVFTEEELEQLGVDCGTNVPQVVCDVYTRGDEATNVHMTISYKDPVYGDVIAYFVCQAIGQGCVVSGITYSALFSYASGPSGVNWNRYAVGPNGIASPLFLANWSIVGGGVRENFPINSGPLYGAVMLQPSVRNNTLVWNSTGLGVGNSNLTIGLRTPSLIEFRTKQGFASNTFISTGTFGLNGNVLGTISIWGMFQP